MGYETLESRGLSSMRHVAITACRQRAPKATRLRRAFFFMLAIALVAGSVVALFWRSSLSSREVLHESRARLRARYSREARWVARRG